MKKYFFTVLLILFFISISYAQYNIEEYRNSKTPIGVLNRLMGYNLYSPKHSYDVLNYKLSLNIYNCFKSPYPRNFIAENTITFKVDSVLNFIKLDAVNTSLVIDSIKLLSGVPLTFNHTLNILTVNLDRTYYPGEIVNIRIFYRHNNVNDNAFIVSAGQVFTDCEEERARCWFPCWDKPSDKATTDVTVKVPSNVLLAGNGRLADSVKIADTVYYHWISRDPMSTYLVAIAGANNYVVDIRYWHKTSNPNDSIPVRFYHRSNQNLSGIKDTIMMFATFFSQKFGDYPFEKICYADVGYSSGGAMENQTLITMNPVAWYYWFFVPHELAHMWFGDLVTCGTWANIWLNEGFATMCELLADEHFLGINNYKQTANTYAESYLADSINHHLSIYNPPDWIYTIIYCKPACVLYMLREVIGDSLFINTLRSFVNDTNYRFKNAITDEFTAKLNSVTGQDYSWFINEWIYQPGHPDYHNTSDIINLGGGNWRLNYTIKQIQLNTVFFKMPVEIKVRFTNLTDTLLKFFSSTNNELFTFNFNKQPDTVIFDPGNKIILKKRPPPVIISSSLNQCSNTLPKPINDLSWTADTINISQQGTIKDIEVTININHSNDGDILIRLDSPNNGISLSQFNGTGGQNYTNTIFDDSASIPITQGTPPFTGRFRPQLPISPLLNQQLTGKWILRIYDSKNGSQGSLLSWCIKIDYQYQVGIKEKNNIVENFELYQNYPNPFNPVTKIKFDVINPLMSKIPIQSGRGVGEARGVWTRLTIFDITGREIQTLVNEKLNPGTYEVTFDGSNYASGVYFYQLQTNNFVQTKKLILLK